MGSAYCLSRVFRDRIRYRGICDVFHPIEANA